MFTSVPELIGAIDEYIAHHPARFMLLWSPGAEDNPLHPGDDAKAREVMERVMQSGIHSDGAGTTVIVRPTQTLAELIAALGECNVLICADGGAMHLAAGLGLPIVCLFGNSGATRWRPWEYPINFCRNPRSTSATSRSPRSSSPSMRCGAVFRDPALEPRLYLGLVTPGRGQPCFQLGKPLFIRGV